MAAIYVGDYGGRAPKARVSSAVGERIERRRREDRGAEGAEGGRVPPSPLEKVNFGAFWVLLLQLN